MKTYKQVFSVIFFIILFLILHLTNYFFYGNYFLRSVPIAFADVTCTDKPTDSTSTSAIVNDVKSKYGIVLGGSSLTTQDALDVFNSMCLVWNSPTYKANLNSLSSPVSVTFLSKSGCLEFTTFNPLAVTMCEGRDSIVNRYVLTHELTHVLQSGTAGRSAYFTDWTNKVWNTEKNHKIPTGPCYYEDKGDGGECEADAVAEFVYYQTYRNSWSGKPAGPNTFNDQQTGFNYKRDFPLEYNFVKDNFFGGLEFSGTGQDTGTTADAANIQFDYPNLAPNSYNYAKTRLFDGVDMFTLSGGTIPTTNGSVDIGMYAKDLADTIRPLCPPGNTDQHWGYVDGSNYTCLNNIPKTFDTAVASTSQNRDAMIKALVSSATSGANNFILQCVGFVLAVAEGVGNPLPQTGNAQDYNKSVTGYTWTPNTSGATMQPGDIAVWKRSSGNGHIAIVSAAHTTSFEVYEANGGNGSVGHDVYSHLDAATADQFGLILEGWLRSDTGSGGNSIPPTTNTCNGKYATDLQRNTWNVNFGDPACTFTKDGLYKLLQQKDPKNADIWFNSIVPCESGFDPNAEQLNDPVDSAHAWGLFQMGRGKNGQYDHGDVEWQSQTINAITYNNNLIPQGQEWRYWACGFSYWQ